MIMSDKFNKKNEGKLLEWKCLQKMLNFDNNFLKHTHTKSQILEGEKGRIFPCVL